MRIDYNFTQEDCEAIWKYFRGYTSISVRNARIWYVAAPAICLGLLLIGAKAGYYWLPSTLLFASLVSIPIHLAYDKWQFHAWLKSSFPAQRQSATYALTADDDGLIVSMEDLFTTQLSWSVITNLVQNESVTVLYLSPSQCFYFPTRAMTIEQRAEFADLTARYVTRKKP